MQKLSEIDRRARCRYIKRVFGVREIGFSGCKRIARLYALSGRANLGVNLYKMRLPICRRTLDGVQKFVPTARRTRISQQGCICPH